MNRMDTDGHRFSLLDKKPVYAILFIFKQVKHQYNLKYFSYHHHYNSEHYISKFWQVRNLRLPFQIIVSTCGVQLMIPMLTKYSYCRKRQSALFLVVTGGLTANHFLVHFVCFLVMFTCIILDFLCINTIMDYYLIYSNIYQYDTRQSNLLHVPSCGTELGKVFFLGSKLSLFGMRFIQMFVLISKLLIITCAAHGLALKKCQFVGCTRDICIDDRN